MEYRHYSLGEIKAYSRYTRKLCSTDLPSFAGANSDPAKHFGSPIDLHERQGQVQGWRERHRLEVRFIFN